MQDEQAQSTNTFWGDLGGAIKSAVSSVPIPTMPAAPKSTSSDALRFVVGENLSPTQKQTAIDTIRTPDVAPDTNKFWDAIKTEFTPRDQAVPIRRAFEINPIETKAPPIVTQAADVGYRLLEGIPRAAAILGGEFKAGFSPTNVKANIDLRRLGFESPDYTTASKQVTDEINNGGDPFQTALKVVSGRTLDLSFGAQLLSDVASLSTKVLLSGGPEARIEAQNVLDAYKVNQKEIFNRLKDAPLDVREKALADIANAKNEAQKVVAREGAPTSLDRLRVKGSRYTEVLGRQTPITKNFWSDIMNPDLSLKTPVSNAPILESKQLPGTRVRPGQAPAFGLSTQEVESVGGAYPAATYDTPEIIKAREESLGSPKTSDIKTPEREALRTKLINEAYDSSPRTQGKRLDIVTGGPGSRKSSLIATPLAEQHGSILADSDLFKPFLGKNTGATHLESAKMNAQLIFKAFDNGDNLVWPTIGQNKDNLDKIISRAKSNGYEVHLHNASLPIDKSIPGIIKRFNETGKFVDPKSAHEIGLQPTAIHDIIKNNENITSATKYSTDVQPGQKALKLEYRKTPKISESKNVDQGRTQGSDGGNRLTKTDLLNQALARAKAGEDFGIRPNREGDAKALEEFKKNPNAVRTYQTTQKQSEEVLKGRSLQPQKDTGGQSLEEWPEPFPSSSDLHLDNNHSPLIKSVADVMENVKPPVGRGGVTPPKMDLLKWKDRSAISLSRETMERNIEAIAGEDGKALKDFLVNKVRNNETNRIEFLNNLRDEVRTKIVKQLGIRAKSEASKIVQQFGERQFGETLQDNIDNLQMRRPNDWFKIKEAAEYIRATYDTLLDKVNAERARFGYEPIPKHEDYFRHFHEMDSTIKNFGLILREQDLPTEIAGMTGIFSPGKPFSTAEMRRRGELGSTEDAVSGLDNYLDSISKQIFHIDSIQRGRTVEKYIRESAKAVANYTSIPSEQIRLPNFVSNVHDYANMLAGKKAQFDRAFESVIGRRVYTVVNWLRGRVAANMVGGNISSALTNFIPFTQSLATTAKPAAIHAITDALTAPFKDNFAEVGGTKSDFLTRRFPDKALDPQGLKKVSDKLNWMFEAVDKFTAKSIVGGKYYEGINKGLSPEEAMKEADNYAGRVLADRSFGQQPNLFNTKTLGFFTQFQLEVNNMYSFMTKDIPKFSEGNKKKIISAIGQFVLYSYLFNEAYQKVTGRRPTIDPIYAGLTLLGMTDTGGDDFKSRLWAATQDLGGNLPFTGLMLQGGRLPVSAAIPDVVGLLKGQADLKKELLKPALYVAPPFGGGQVKKTIEGAMAIKDGGTFSPSGTFQYKTPTDTLGKVQTALFGKYASQSSQDYFNRQNITSKEQAPIKKIYDQVQKLKSGGKEDQAQEIVDNLSDTDYAIYKQIRTNEKRKDTVQAEKEMYKTAIKVKTLIDSGNESEAQNIVDDMTDEEYRIYQLAKKKL